MTPPSSPPASPRRIRWWPAIVIVAAAVGALIWIRFQDDWPFQQKTLRSIVTSGISFAVLLVWWTAFSRTRSKLRLGVLALILGTVGGIASVFRITGVSGDLFPILEPRWARRSWTPSSDAPASPSRSPSTNAIVASSPSPDRFVTNAISPHEPPSAEALSTAPAGERVVPSRTAGSGIGRADAASAAQAGEVEQSAVAVPREASPPSSDFPQFLGPDRTAKLPGPALDSDWKSNPPQLLWKQPIGAAWSGFVVVGGNRAITQEQRGEQELITCYDLGTGRLVWSHAESARYQTTIAGEGPRATPSVAGRRVYALGATGFLNCLELETGKLLWRRSITDDAGSKMPDWGFSGSPLVIDGRVYISAGGKQNRSMIAYDAETGEIAWAVGNASVSYSSPFATTLAGQRQILMFNAQRIAAHHPVSGKVLWEYPWDASQPHIAVPIIVGTNRVVFSSGYGVGSELLEIAPKTPDSFAARRVWKSNRMKAKFSNLVAHDGFLFGLDDGILACVDLKDGALRWKEGRYGHGQGLLIGDHYLLMAESGELVLLHPSASGPNELGRFRVFSDKTWNPIALSGPLLLVRNDRTAACLRLAVR